MSFELPLEVPSCSCKDSICKTRTLFLIPQRIGLQPECYEGADPNTLSSICTFTSTRRFATKMGIKRLLSQGRRPQKKLISNPEYQLPIQPTSDQNYFIKNKFILLERERERKRISSSFHAQLRSPIWGSIPRPWDHDPSWNQEVDRCSTSSVTWAPLTRTT